MEVDRITRNTDCEIGILFGMLGSINKHLTVEYVNIVSFAKMELIMGMLMNPFTKVLQIVLL